MNKIPKNAGAQFDRRILVAEDDEALALALRDTLKQQCFDVVVVPNGQAAKDLLAAEKFDLVVSDIRMPHVNGIELLAHVKKNFCTPLILMTSS